MLIIVLCTTGCTQKKEIDNVAIEATLSIQKVFPEKDNYSKCKYQYRVWTKLQNKSSKSVFFYDPALVFLLKKEGKWLEDYSIFNQLDIPCKIKISNDTLMNNWFKYQKHSGNFEFSKTIVERFIIPTGLSEIQKMNMAEFIFLKPNESITYPFTINKEITEIIKVSVKSSPDVCLGINNFGFIMSKYTKRIPDKFEGYEYLKASFSSDTIQIEP